MKVFVTVWTGETREVEVEPVLGHLCDGLAKFNGAGKATGCIPEIGTDGIVAGCDDENTDNPIAFCPFCGVNLMPA